MTSGKSIVHIGMHKTGSTSIQAFLSKFKSKLRTQGVDFYSGKYLVNNHVELHASAMRVSRMSPFKMDAGLLVDKSFRAEINEHIRQFIAQSDCDTYVFSAEGLAYLRYSDEMKRLKQMMPTGKIEIVVYLREQSKFLASYKAEMKKHKMPRFINRDSFAYVADDSWLLNFDDRIARFQKSFGLENVRVLSYDKEISKWGSVIPSFLDILGIAPQYKGSDWAEIILNKTVLD